MIGNSNLHSAIDAAKTAERDNKQPYVVTAENIKSWKAATANGEYPTLPFPFFGSYVPKGYKVTANYILDTTAAGLEGKPTLTARAFDDKLIAGRGYAVTEAAEDKVFIAEFEKTA